MLVSERFLGKIIYGNICASFINVESGKVGVLTYLD
jgi:hypothetical protein